jgi:putative transposase
MKSGQVWQNRFWDHILSDQEDLNRHIDYIHYNPVKHGLTDDPLEWEHSSFRVYRSRGFYSDGWGVTDDPTDGRATGE